MCIGVNDVCKEGNEKACSQYNNIVLTVDDVEISCIVNFERVEYNNPKKDYLFVKFCDCPKNIENNHDINMLKAKKRFKEVHLKLDKTCQSGETTTEDIKLFDGEVGFISQSWSAEDQGIIRMEFEVQSAEEGNNE